MTLAAEAERVDGDIMPDGRHHVLQDAPPRLVKQHVVGDDARYLHPGREGRELVQAKLVVGPATQGQRQIGAIPEALAQAAQPPAAFRVGEIRHEDGDQALPVGKEIAPVEMTPALPARRLPSDSSRQRRE